VTSENLDIDPGMPAGTPAGPSTGTPSSGTSAGEPVGQDQGEPQETAAPQPADDTQAPLDTDTLVADLEKSQRVVAELTGDLQRLQAEFVNYKRRVDRDRDLVRENATFSVLAGLLPVLDDIDRAREAGDLEGGFKAVADSLERAVAGLGLVKYGQPGDEFDPNLHEALMHGHSPDVTTTTCQTIISSGYRIGERVVRPARVTVVDPQPAAQSVTQPAGEPPAEAAEPTDQLPDE